MHDNEYVYEDDHASHEREAWIQRHEDDGDEADECLGCGIVFPTSHLYGKGFCRGCEFGDEEDLDHDAD